MARGSQKPHLFTRALRLAARFARAQRGGVAVMFGLAFPVVAILTFFAVDYSRASLAKQTMQDSLDAAALFAARSTATTDAQIDAIGDAAFIAQLPTNTTIAGLSPDAGGHIANVTFTLVGTKVVATAVGTVTPLLAGVYLAPTIDIHANSEVVRSLNKLEIAMVLDTTGSMQGTKISNLITAAKNFITTMQDAASHSTQTNPVKISIIPFSTTVKIMSPMSMASYDTTNHTLTGLPSWMDGRAQSTAWNNDIFTNASSAASTRVDRFSMLKAIGQSWGGCVEARAAPYDIRDTAPDTSDVNTLFTPFFWPDEPDTDSAYLNDYLNDVSSSSSWSVRQGYSPKYNTSTFKVSGTFIPSSGYGAAWAFGPNAACNMQGLMRLSTDFNALRTQIDGLVASGETNIPLGLMWGWHTLSPNAPFGDGVAYGTEHVTKIVVLMTDGENTMNDTSNANNSNNSWYHGYGYIWQNKLGTTSNTAATRTQKMDERLIPPTGTTNEALCDNMKAKDIQIYTVGVGVTAASKTLLTACATEAGNYYDVDSQAANLNAAFDAIAGSIQNLRISK